MAAATGSTNSHAGHESHLHGIKQDQVKNVLARSRGQAEFLSAEETDRGGASGGQMFCWRDGQSAYRLHHFDVEGNGFLANVLQRQHWEIVLVSIYLKCGEDLNSRANSTVLGALAKSWLCRGLWLEISKFRQSSGRATMC